MNELESIKIKYEEASKENKAKIKSEWDRKVGDIAATIRQLCQD